MILSIKDRCKGIFILSPYYIESNREDFMRKRMDEYVEICKKLAKKYNCFFVNFQKLFEKLGAAWWFCDHKRGIKEEIEIISENSTLGSFLGMLTDSRSFLSYARHDYFRRILADILGKWVENGEFDENASYKLAEKMAYKNIKELVG